MRGLLKIRSTFWRAIATNVNQKESGSCPAVEVKGVKVCGGRVRCVYWSGEGMWWKGDVCRSSEGMRDSAGNGTVGWHV